MTKARWVDYRPEIKVLDCSVRDGGLITDHMFEDDLVKTVFETCRDAGVDYMEFGYKADKKIFAPDKYGDWKYCDEDSIRRIIGDNETDMKISVMADAEKTDYKRDLLPKDQSVIDLVRVATYIHQVPTAVDMIHDAHDKGYEVCVNLMALSLVKESELDGALEIFAQTPAKIVVIVDSFGSLYSEQIRAYARRFLKAVKGTGKEIGIHAHNNQQLAYANTIEAIISGVNYLDATIMGIGRGAGNCPMELLLSFLHNPKFNLRPVLKLIQDRFLSLREEIEWGPLIPYIITAHFNQHPRAAMELRASDKKNDFVEFYDHLNET